jgi:ATP-dependent exoDNAse (exonuclease V) beta subunit
MKKADLDRLADNPKWISGIHNYCDRWCERCAFTKRCLSFAMEQEENRQHGGVAQDKEAFWKRFEASLALTREMIDDLAKAQGVTVDEAELAQIGRALKQRKREARNHPVAQAALAYGTMAQEWFKSGEDSLHAKEEEILAQAKLGVASVQEEVASLTDVVEILRWYQHQIYVKLARGFNADRDYAAASGLPKDSEGSVKVALIAMDRSVAAWLRMKDFFPEQTDSILTMLLHLDRLRRGSEKEFPNARAFVRPGFDTGDSPE